MMLQFTGLLNADPPAVKEAQLKLARAFFAGGEAKDSKR